MKIDDKYRISNFPLNFKVIEAFDFREDPILLLEQDLIGNFYLSYLSNIQSDNEQRIYLQLSKERLGVILENEMTLCNAFLYPENNYVYILDFNLNNGNVTNAYLIPNSDIHLYLTIPEDYLVETNFQLNNLTIDVPEIISYSERKQKLVLDFYVQSQNLINNIKPYALFKIFNPLIDIVKNMLSIDNRNVDKYLAFSNLRQSSLGITIEINYSHDLFLQKETIVIERVMQLLNASEKSEFVNIISNSTNEKFIKDYSIIIKSIIDNDANLFTAYANPITKNVITSKIDKVSAQKVKLILDESFDVIEDIEDVTGTFLEIDIDSKEPSFKVHSTSEDITLKGKFEISMLDKVKNDFINIGKETYKFSIKTMYHPETTVKSEEIKRFMIDYIKL